MTCTSCANKVTGAVTGVAGVESTDVDLATGALTVSGNFDDDTVRGAIIDAGYQIA